MSLTGTGIRIGTATEFGSVIRFPRGLATDGTTVWLFDANKGYVLDPATGLTTVVAAGLTNFGAGEGSVRSATYHNNQILVWGRANERIQIFDPTDGTLGHLHLDRLVYGGSETGTPDLWGIASLNGILYGLDGVQDALYTISSGILTRVGTATAFGISAENTRGFTAYRNMLIATDSGLDRIFSIHATTGVGTIIGPANSMPDASPEALVEFDGKLLLAGSANDALFRLYDVLWDETIANFEVDEAASQTWSLAGVVQDAASFAFVPGQSPEPPSWLAVSETDLVATDAPDVNADQNHDVQVRATREGINVDETLRVVVAAALVLPTWQASIPAISVNEGNDHTTDTEQYLTDATGLEFAPSHTARSWLSVSGFDLVITGAPDVTADTDYDVVLRATSSDGHRDKTLTVRVIAEAAPPLPLNPPIFTAPAANYEVNERASPTIDSTEFFTGHTSLAFQTGSTAPSWLTISGLNVVITGAPDVLEDTDFTVPLTGANNDGSVNGSITISVQQIDPTPVFGTPNRFDIDEGSSSVFDLSGDLQHTESLAYQSGYSAPSWLTISGLTLVITNAEQVSQDTDFDVLLAAESTKTAATADRTVTIRVRDVTVPQPSVTPPGAPTSLSLTKTHNSIVARWAAAANNGGEAPSRYDIQINGGGWIDAGLDLTHTFENLSPETQYTLDVAQVNSAGRGTPASKSVRTDAAPIVITTPGAPRSLSLTKTHNSIVARWAAAANNGGEAPSRYDVRINRGQWIDTGLDLRHTFENLLPETEYLIEVVQVNSAGRGTPASRRVRTDAAPTAPAAPQNLTVELTATTAILKWAISGTGSPADTYEVSYAEGDRVGSDWIDTKSLRTRFFIRRLKRATRYTFGVRGRNSEGAGDASSPVTQNTPIASLHNALFFKECVNYLDNGGRVSEHGNTSNIIREVADNDYQTFSNVTDYAIDMSRNNQPTRVDAVFIKSKGITQHSGTPTGGSGTGWTNEALPETVENWEGTEVSTTVAGFQHHLYLLDSHFTATSVRVQFEGTGVKVYEMMLLEFGISIDANGDFTEIATNFVDREGVIHSDPGGGIAYDASIGDQRDKWEVDYVVRVVPGKTMLETPEDFLYWRAKNRNHVFCMEPSRFPWRIFPAVFVGKSVPVRYRTDDKTGGEILNFRVAEQ